jgi:hypothetical protein
MGVSRSPTRIRPDSLHRGIPDSLGRNLGWPPSPSVFRGRQVHEGRVAGRSESPVVLDQQRLQANVPTNSIRRDLAPGGHSLRGSRNRCSGTPPIATKRDREPPASGIASSSRTGTSPTRTSRLLIDSALTGSAGEWTQWIPASLMPSRSWAMNTSRNVNCEPICGENRSRTDKSCIRSMITSDPP